MYYVESLRWKVEEGFDPELGPVLKAEDLEWHLQRNDDEAGGPRKAAYRLSLSLPPKENRFPYSFEIVLIGFFELHDTVRDEQITRVLDSNAPALLYSAAREALATSVGRGPFRPLLLPSVHFLGLEREDAKPKKAATTAARRNTKAITAPARKIANSKAKVSEARNKTPPTKHNFSK